MALANYADLQTAVNSFLHRSDLAGMVPDMITLAETRINGDLDARLQDTKTTLTTTANNELVALPNDTINIRHISVSGVTPISTLDYMTPDQFETSYAYEATGLPQAYTVVGSSIYLAPIPDAVYTLDLLYKAKVPNLATNSVTWLMTNYPNVYLYATLCEFAPYIKDKEMIQVWEMKYKEAIQSVNSQDWYSGSTMKVRVDYRP